jgi:spore coat protein U-like protein
MKTSKKLIAAACASAAMLMGGAAFAADSHTITVNATVAGNCKFNSGTSSVNMTIDPNATTTVTGNAAVAYRCTKGTSPVFALSSGSTSSATGGNLMNGTEAIPYTYTSTSGGAGTGLGAGQDKTLSVSVSVNQANAANVSPNTYTDTIAITLTP